jgi:hypothetical protein
VARGGAVVETVVGNVRVEYQPATKAIQATVGMDLPEGSMISTGKNGRVFIRFGITDLVRLKGDSTIVISQLKGSRPTRTNTLLQLVTGTMRAMLRRSGSEKVQNFGVVAGSTVCAVKGTMFDMIAPPQGALAGKVEVRCDDGGVGVGTIASGADLGAFDIGTASTRVLRAGYMVSASAVTGKIELARRAPPRTSLEVVGGTGKVTATTGNKTVVVQPGDEVPAGSKVTVTGGSAVLAGTRTAVQAGDGTSFAYDAKTEDVKGAGAAVTTVVTVTAGSVTADTGGRSVTVGAGSAAVVSSGGLMTQMPAAVAASVLNPPAAPAAAPAAKPAAEPEPPAAEPAYAPGEVLPELPALPPASDVTPPPTTPGQDTETVTPPGTGDETPVSPNKP